MALVYGFGGMRNRDGCVSFRPRLPARISRLCFPLRLGGSVLEVDVTAGTVSYRVRSGGPLQIRHYDTVVDLEQGAPVTIAGSYGTERARERELRPGHTPARRGAGTHRGPPRPGPGATGRRRDEPS